MSAKDSNEFNVLQFEKKLTALKDSQESINNCCQWCLSNRQHHKKIVNSWLNVLKRVKVEHRLILFYLANDVIQYSKRKKYEYVESWGTALQKATTLVRDEKVKQKILRIFKIWEDRNIYNEEFIADLCGLISVTPTAPKNDEPHEFQSSYVINKIRVCTNLENDTDVKLKKLNELHPKILETESYYTSLKDRAHLDDAEKDLDCYVSSMEDYINALKVEIKNRINLISVLKQAEGQLDTDRKDVKVVANAYKAYGTRVKTFQKKLEEHKATLASPIPSPDVNAPSPTSDTDIELPDPQTSAPQETHQVEPAKTEIDLMNIQITNANYYNPVPAPVTETTAPFLANGFTSFIGSNLPFNVQNFNSSDLFSTNSTSTAPQTTNSNFGSLPSVIPSLSQTIPEILQPPLPPKTEPFSYPSNTHSIPLLPPPMPPFGAKEDTNFTNGGNYETRYDNETVSDYGPPSFNANTSYGAEANYPPAYSNTPADSSYDPITTLFSNEPTFETPIGANPYPPSEEYNPEEDIQTWDGDLSWAPPPLDNTDTPESPPPFEKEAFGDPIEYHDNIASSGAADVDHRVLPSNLMDTGKMPGRNQDVDHRNLISLIGSPATDSNSNQLCNSEGWSGGDQDYRQSGDKDYRLPFDIGEQLKLPPPPPPPNPHACPIPVVSGMNHSKKLGLSFPQDNVESIDMELSDEEAQEGKDHSNHNPHRENLRVVIDGIIGSNSNSQSLKSPIDLNSRSNSQDGMTSFASNKSDLPLMLEPPPPLPELPDDAEENLLLDQMNNDINDFLLNPEDLEENLSEPFWNSDSGNLQPPPMFQHMNSIPPPPMAPPMNWMGDHPSSFQPSYNNGPYQGGKNFKRNKFMNNRGTPRGRGGFMGNFNDNYSNRGSGNNFRGRGRGNARFPWGNNFRGNRGHRGGY
ncbi:regulation of nuclear pre-mRNA domain-containing protein 2 isoform X2 [Coccinella septempunctata]|uniref:regulation of nuclear pre-mRNA domain-containing protein 2 isoform X2 n=1 Tax=Coccinella septempunctata TaxID=41139 RepID=UPI001D067C82|nr:regulation of nuclear pre-mRNA domain-containing protein 2 isoform X2 [Coccinella septempunctata]